MPPRPRLFDDHLNTKAGPHAAPLTPTFANMPPRWDANVGVGPLASGFAHAQSDGWRRWALGAVGSAPGRAEHRYQRLVRIAAQCIIGLNDANIGATALALVSLFAPISCFALVAFLALVTFDASHPLRSLRTGGTGGALRTCRTLRSLLTFRTWIAATCRQCKRNPQNQYWNESHGLPSQPSFHAVPTLNQCMSVRHQISLRRMRLSARSIRLLRLQIIVLRTSFCRFARALCVSLPRHHNHDDCDIIRRPSVPAQTLATSLSYHITSLFHARCKCSSISWAYCF